MTYTYALMGVTRSTYDEIKRKLEAAGYHHALHNNRLGDEVVLDMHGIALQVTEELLKPSEPPILVDWGIKK